MTSQDVLDAMKTLGVAVVWKGRTPHLRAQAGDVPPELTAVLRWHREAILAHFPPPAEPEPVVEPVGEPVADDEALSVPLGGGIAAADYVAFWQGLAAWNARVLQRKDDHDKRASFGLAGSRRRPGVADAPGPPAG